MKQLQLRDGDLVLGAGGFSTVEGAARLAQDLGCAVREEIGTDRFHPKWGTVLYDYVGRASDIETSSMVKTEVARVLQNYLVIQSAQVSADQAAGLKSRYKPGDLVDSIPSIQTQIKGDQINVRAIVNTSSGESIAVVKTVEG